jgi:hypothetical protein
MDINFNRRIITDGIGCTITFVRNNLYDPLKKTKVACLKKPSKLQILVTILMGENPAYGNEI